MAVGLKQRNNTYSRQMESLFSPLRCQIQLEVTRKRYNAEERLQDLFGEPERWSQTLHMMLWTHASVIVKPFTVSVCVRPACSTPSSLNCLNWTRSNP